ncbi:uncharacterized protein LOC8037559 isoform X1 [Ixodes scapularis]|uniref:uncharacterized protein LOC8037559 isoform X1 n=1 Tax=Ixodes scapularis TaxID=6945 RepID=UPI001AD68761|nr:uncharacterized protein LOC8037559 isoform X1 [Ixodes scapularis]
MGAQPQPGEVPPASSFVKPCKKGTLSKIVGRRWLFLPLWKERYCVLDDNKLYYYENETSKGTNSNCGVIHLENFDVCEEYESKAVQNAFIITTANRGFFDVRPLCNVFNSSNRVEKKVFASNPLWFFVFFSFRQPCHTFAADTLPEVCDWIANIRSKLNPTVQKRTSFIRKSLSKRRKNRHSLEKQLQNVPRQSPDPALDIPGKEPLESITKNRAKGPAGRRPPQRKSQMPKPATVGVQDHGRSEVPVLAVREVFEEEEEETADSALRDETDRPRPTSTLLYQYSSSSDEDDQKETDVNKSVSEAIPEAAGQAKETESHDKPSSPVAGNVDEVQERMNKLREQLCSHIDDATMQSLLKQLDYCELELQTAVQTVHEVLNEAAAAVLAKTKQAETEEPTPA